MKEVIKIIKQLESTSGTNDKIAIIKNNSANETFKKIMIYTYADDKMYGFSDKKLRAELEKFDTSLTLISNYSNGFDLLDVLASSNINDSLRKEVYTFLSFCSEEEREIWIRVITKDLRCKISAKGINKAIPNLIFVWEVQQGMQRHKVKLKKDEWIAISLKLNGIRSTNFRKQFKSRQNKVQNGYSHIQSDLDKLGLGNMVFDGELIRKNVDNVSDNENFRLTTSIVNSDSSSKDEIELVIFDMLPEEEFILGESKLTFKDRLIKLQEIQAKIDELKLTNIRIAPNYYAGNDHSKIEEILNKIDGMGYEGIMILRDMPYKCKRHNGIIKGKVFNEGDFKITGFKEGQGDLKGTLGSIFVEFKGNPSVGVGGYKDEVRDEIWNNQSKYLGTIIKVKYKDESKDKDTGLPSLQFASFLEFRPDKTEANYE